MLNYTAKQRAHLALVRDLSAKAVQELHLNHIKSLVDEVLDDINDHTPIVNNPSYEDLMKEMDTMIDEEQRFSWSFR